MNQTYDIFIDFWKKEKFYLTYLLFLLLCVISHASYFLEQSQIILFCFLNKLSLTLFWLQIFKVSTVEWELQTKSAVSFPSDEELKKETWKSRISESYSRSPCINSYDWTTLHAILAVEHWIDFLPPLGRYKTTSTSAMAFEGSWWWLNFSVRSASRFSYWSLSYQLSIPKPTWALWVILL